MSDEAKAMMNLSKYQGARIKIDDEQWVIKDVMVRLGSDGRATADVELEYVNVDEDQMQLSPRFTLWDHQEGVGE